MHDLDILQFLSVVYPCEFPANKMNKSKMGVRHPLSFHSLDGDHLQVPVVDTAQTWASFKQLYLPDESKPAQGPLIQLVEDLKDYMKHGITLGWFGFL